MRYWMLLVQPVAIPWNLLTLWVEVLESYAGRNHVDPHLQVGHWWQKKHESIRFESWQRLVGRNVPNCLNWPWKTESNNQWPPGCEWSVGQCSRELWPRHSASWYMNLLWKLPTIHTCKILFLVRPICFSWISWYDTLTETRYKVHWVIGICNTPLVSTKPTRAHVASAGSRHFCAI